MDAVRGPRGGDAGEVVAREIIKVVGVAGGGGGEAGDRLVDVWVELPQKRDQLAAQAITGGDREFVRRVFSGFQAQLAAILYRIFAAKRGEQERAGPSPRSGCRRLEGPC